MASSCIRRNFLVVLIHGMAMIGGLSLSAQDAEPRRMALLVGNSAYQRNALPNPVNDARDFSHLLKEAGFQVSVATDLDLRGMEESVRAFSRNLRYGDTVLVFYAGHGIESGGINYLIPVDNAGLQVESDLKYKAYPASRILDEIAAKDAGLAMLILDACRDNPFPSRSSMGSRGLSVMAAPPDLESVIMYSTAPGTTAADGAGRNSVFMRSLLAEVQTPNLTVREVFDRVGGAVKAATAGAQVPWLNSTPLSRPFVFFSGEMALTRAASLSATAQRDLDAQRTKIAELESAKARAKDEAARQKFDTELATARALEAAKKLESDRLAVESARLAEERRKAEAAAEAKRKFDDAEAAKAALMKDEAAKLRLEYERLVRADDSAPEFIRQINALEKALKDIATRYEAIRADGEKGITALYAQKAEALKAALVIEPWENDAEFRERTKGAYGELDRQKAVELARYGRTITDEQASQEKDLRERLEKVNNQFAATTYTQSGSSLQLSFGAFDRNRKVWPIRIESKADDFFFLETIEYSIASAEDIGSAYRAFETAMKAGALAAEIDYSYIRIANDVFVLAKARTLRIKDLTTNRTMVEVTRDPVVFYLSNAAPGARLMPQILRLRGVLEGSTVSVNGKEVSDYSSGVSLGVDDYSVAVGKIGYKRITLSGKAVPGQLREETISQIKFKSIVEMLEVQGGSFIMGSKTGYTDEQPAHHVTLSTFYIGKYEITQTEYQKVMGANPAKFSLGNESRMRPVENVNWFDAIEFCNKLSAMDGLELVYKVDGLNVRADFSKDGYRLPTEAEWEFAARGGDKSKGKIYSGSDEASAVSWYYLNSSRLTQPVGRKEPNEIGLYDMSGNVREWCWDGYAEYSDKSVINPTGAISGVVRVIRGGAFGDLDPSLRIKFRNKLHQLDSQSDIGFRVVRRP